MASAHTLQGLANHHARRICPEVVVVTLYYCNRRADITAINLSAPHLGGCNTGQLGLREAIWQQSTSYSIRLGTAVELQK
ncbi:hypothetical protein CMUS01_06308 [Colletotrichum musicola]|uniref:Uncharacterized protein n=1 Tax=Colletotrichum musicola TaxID=2175873 RepID=A0A8H6KMJ1_9PEZI|nr:hypothetical protein CMUS01_06308 [Colletotrichum musicola]